jgi:hypothetical protein
VRCGKTCGHPRTTFHWRVIENGQTAHAEKISLCLICGFHLAVVSESSPRALSSLDNSGRVAPAVPSPQDLATDPLWRELRACWLLPLLCGDFEPPTAYAERRFPELRLLVNWRGGQDHDAYPDTGRAHQEALAALVSLKRLDAKVASLISRAFEEFSSSRIREISESGIQCYLVHHQSMIGRGDNLIHRANALLEAACSGSLDPATVERVWLGIARDLAAFRYSLLEASEADLSSPDPNEREAARIILALLPDRA